MWHQARKQEKRLHGMVVESRRRADRRQAAAALVATDVPFLVTGKRMKVRTASIAEALALERSLVRWQGRADNEIDRYDVRGQLEEIPTMDEAEQGAATPDRGTKDYLERHYEAFRDLITAKAAQLAEQQWLDIVATVDHGQATGSKGSATKSSNHTEENQAHASVEFDYGDTDSDGTPPVSANVRPKGSSVEHEHKVQTDGEHGQDLIDLLSVDPLLEHHLSELDETHERQLNQAALTLRVPNFMRRVRRDKALLDRQQSIIAARRAVNRARSRGLKAKARQARAHLRELEDAQPDVEGAMPLHDDDTYAAAMEEVDREFGLLNDHNRDSDNGDGGSSDDDTHILDSIPLMNSPPRYQSNDRGTHSPHRRSRSRSRSRPRSRSRSRASGRRRRHHSRSASPRYRNRHHQGYDRGDGRRRGTDRRWSRSRSRSSSRSRSPISRHGKMRARTRRNTRSRSPDRYTSRSPSRSRRRRSRSRSPPSAYDRDRRRSQPRSRSRTPDRATHSRRSPRRRQSSTEGERSSTTNKHARPTPSQAAGHHSTQGRGSGPSIAGSSNDTGKPLTPMEKMQRRLQKQLKRAVNTQKTKEEERKRRERELFES